MMLSVDHADEGKRYLDKGLRLIKKSDVSNAAEAFFHAAVEFEKAQDFKQIPALWEAIGKLSELKGDSIPPVTEKWLLDLKQIPALWEAISKVSKLTGHSIPLVTEKWPLDYHIMETDEWNEKKEKTHKLAWVYQWAAEHRERVKEHNLAYPLFLKSADNAEQTKQSKNDPEWPAKLYRKAALNLIRTHGTIEHAPDDHGKDISEKESIKSGIEKMETHYLRIEDKGKAYSFIAISYRLLKSELIEAGNLAEAEQFKRKERSALTHYYLHKGSYFRAVTEWLSGSGFNYFVMGLALMILFVFPYIYYQWNLVASVQGKITYLDTILYSIELALGIRHDEFYAIGYGRILNIIGASLSWLGLGVFIWWLTKRLE